MARTKSSGRWLDEHFNDDYVKRAQREGYRSRAVYKLLELQEKDRFLKQGMVVVDLGAAPGGWSQVAQKLVGRNGRVIGLDILPIDPLEGVQFLQEDFTEDAAIEKLKQCLGNRKIDVVLSDLAPNMSGNRVVDQSKGVLLAELAQEFAEGHLRVGGVFLTKIFQGEGFDTYLQGLRRSFDSVSVRKPKASRPRSAEIYLFAKGYRRSATVDVPLECEPE